MHKTKAVDASAESAKRRKYTHRIMNVEYGLFTLMLFSSFGGRGVEATRCYQPKRRAETHVKLKTGYVHAYVLVF